ncbi:MAG: hypothetical protein IKM59_07470, partial [Oscillospiraceae bacterium]|nr:hypothetical protein [Oscillospiraceae bacterium]
MTNLKVSGLEFHTNPNSVATLHYNEYGVLVDTTATETVAFAMPNLYLLARQLMAANHMLPEDELPGQAAELTFRSVSLSLQSSIGMNLYVAKETLQGYVDPFVRLTKTVYDETGKASTVTVDIYDYEEVQVQGQDCIRFFYGDIAAKEMGSNVHMELMATDSNLLRVMEGENRDYSVVQYAKNMLEKNLPAQFKTLLVDMVNYGAEAQAHFRYNTANPANAGFEAYQHLATVAQPNMVSCTNKDSVNELAPMPEGVGYLTKVAGASLVLEDKVKVNLFVDVKDGSGQDNLGRTVKVAYADVTGTTVVEDVVIAASHLDSNGKYYRVTFDGLHATDMRTAFMAWVVNAEGVRISNTMTYSIESYGASVMSGTASAYVAMQPLVVAMMKYGDSAKAYFSNSK